MVATNLKAETKSLIEKRTVIEADINAIIDRLCRPGGPGISGNLVDSERMLRIPGFPRSDIDIPVVRADRHRLAELRNDYKIITERINENIQVLHSVRLGSRSPAVKDSDKSEDQISFPSGAGVSSSNILPRDALSAVDMDIITSIPFAMVDEISEESPAAEGGLQLGDQIVRFGNVESGDNLSLRLNSELETNEGCAVHTLVMRQGALINLTVTPRTWQGGGLLGCHLRIL